MKLLKKPKAGAPTVHCKRSWVQKNASRIFFASLLLATVLPVSKVWAQTGYDVTLSGEELLGQPDVVFHETPNIVGTSIDMLSVGESFLFEWSLLPPQTRGPVLVRATIDYTPMTSDNDPTIGIHDGINQVGYLRSDNVGGSLFKREGIVNGITLPSPPLGPFGPQDLDPVETFEMSFFVPGDGSVPTSFEFLEEGDFFRDEFENFTIDADGGLTLFWGGGTNGETYRLHTITVQVSVASSITEGLAYFPVPNCRIAKTDKSAAGRLERYETREYVVRGETRNFGSQGGSDNGCGIPQEAEAIVANFWLFSHDGNGRLRAGATDQNLGSNILINFSELTVESYTNATVVNLCRNNVCPNDFQVNVEGAASGTHLAIDVAGYFAPIASDGTNTGTTTTTESLTITGLDCSSNSNGGALTAGPGGVVSCSDDDSGGGVGKGGNTLNDAYNQGGAGGGRVITTDAGAVLITGDGGLELDGSQLVQSLGISTSLPSLANTNAVALGPTLDSSIYASGHYTYMADTSGSFFVVDTRTVTLVGAINVGAGSSLSSVYSGGSYVYVTDRGADDLKVVDVSDPSDPTVIGSVFLGSQPDSVVVSGRYAYTLGNSLDVIDVTDPASPTLVRSLPSVGSGSSDYELSIENDYGYLLSSGEGVLEIRGQMGTGNPGSFSEITLGRPVVDLFVSAAHAYVITDDGHLLIVDASNPSAPELLGEPLAVGSALTSVYVSGRYAYVSGDSSIQIIDVLLSDSPVQVGSVETSGQILDIVVSGVTVHARDSAALHFFPLTSAEFGALAAHSVEFGQLRVHDDLIARGQLQVAGGLSVGAGGIYSAGNVGVSQSLSFAENATVGATPSDLVQLYAQDGGGGTELIVQDAAGNVTTLSPHNFSLIGEPSEPLAWSYYSENEHGKINVDMLRALRLLEEVSGEQLIHLDLREGLGNGAGTTEKVGLRQQLKELELRNQQLEEELEQIKARLGIDG